MQNSRRTTLNGAQELQPQRRGERPRRRTLIAVVVGLVGLIADQGAKQWAIGALADQPPRPLIGEVLQLQLAFNPGAAFGTGRGLTPLITVVAMVASIAVLVMMVRVRHAWWALGLGLLFAGIGGNLIDRIFRDPGPFRGHVVDFLELPNWPIFNLADVCINVGAALVLIQVVRGMGIDGVRRVEPADGAGNHKADSTETPPS